MRITMRMNKKGSFAVLATILFSSMMILTAAAIQSAGQEAISSTAESFGPLWGKSILAEYDRNLKDRYGIFAFYGSKLQVEEKLDFYAAYSCEKKKYISCGKSICELEKYALKDKENFLKQVREAALAGTKPRALKMQAGKTSGTTKTSEADGGDEGNRYIRNERILNSLPSEGKGGSVGILSLADKLKEGASLSTVVNASAENVYIFRFFKDCMNERELGETFFRNEVEYLLTGKPDDQKAKKKVRNSLILLRNSLNLAYLYSCEEKRNAALAAAELIMPTAPILTQALILEGWAYMEARNDLKILYAGKTVPILKKDENWAISLENLLAAEYGLSPSGEELPEGQEYEEEKNYLPPKKIEGKDYEGYLRILVAAMPQETLLLRMMDIIQINMKYLYCEWFLMDDYYTGLRYSIEVNKRKHEFEETY